ncbi:MAG: photosystem II protein Psb27, partial [Microcystis panniformis]
MSLKPYISRLLALVLVLVIGLMGCSGSSGLTGNYGQDTLTVIETLTTALDLV